MSRRSSAALSSRPTHAFGAAAVGVLTLSSSLAAASGQQTDIVIQPQTVLYGNPGSVSTVATHNVADELVGKTCVMRVTTENNSSVHPGTAAIFTTGPSSITVNGVEDSPNGGLLSTQKVTLGNKIVVDVRLGPDGSSSMGFTASFDCTTPYVAPDGGQSGTTTTTTAASGSSITGKAVVGGVTTSNPGSSTTSTSTPVTVKKAPAVLGRQQAAALPRTPAAKATVASPNFTG